MATTPTSERMRMLNAELNKLIDKYQQFAAEEHDHEIAVFHVCELLSDAQHKARVVVRLMELR